MKIRIAIVFSALLMTCAAACTRTQPTVAPAARTTTTASCNYCPVQLNNQAASSFHTATNQQPNGCAAGMSNGFPLQDANCTPGAENPTVTLAVLQNPAFRTGCIRNCVTTEVRKYVTYSWYGLTEPSNNYGNNQTCELDHLVPLELGGADTLDNIWPQCGPPGASLTDRYFKQKDMVENYLAAQVKAGHMDLETARRQIATDWTPFLAAAKQWCASGNCP